ncbi:hypothetical protein ERX37_07735 [Macrococcus hajekii]|uniref:Uncharacterized protein n=1 Tax=Macrococcus hajekii TaxID=198482 RepID=A0A4R6BK35_9STAP|nr:hypothetical protein [Macrococcus hajekii]TDM02083.1 hypothetical protein ERX37_07735 [Macrococcus hajekii]GGB09961.1 hypothetical protein GCM10007190_17520 [Macrococcus hajekii]
MDITNLLLTSILMFIVFEIIYLITDRLLNHFSENKKPYNFKYAIFMGILMVIFYMIASRIF